MNAPQTLHDCRDAFTEALEAIAFENANVVAVCNDSVGSSKLGGFRERWPERLINVGIAEQNLVGVGAGLAPHLFRRGGVGTGGVVAAALFAAAASGSTGFPAAAASGATGFLAATASGLATTGLAAAASEAPWWIPRVRRRGSERCVGFEDVSPPGECINLLSIIYP